MTARPAVSVVVLSHNRPSRLLEALESLAAQTRRPEEVLIVDNRSARSEEIAGIAARFPEFRLIANSENLGFTGGMNLGLRSASGEIVLLTEDDIVLEPGTMAALTDHLDANPEVVAGGLMLRSGGGIHCAGGRLRLGTRFELEVIGQGDPDDGQFADPFPVNYLPGAFLCARRQVWRRLGGFRDVFFMYMEDVDLCLRAAAAGIRMDVVPAARVRHYDAPADTAPAWLHRLKSRNFLRVYLLNASLPVNFRFLLRYGLVSTAFDLARFKMRGWHKLRALAATAVELPQLLRLRHGRPIDAGAAPE